MMMLMMMMMMVTVVMIIMKICKMLMTTVQHPMNNQKLHEKLQMDLKMRKMGRVEI